VSVVNNRHAIGFIAGLVVFGAILLLPAPSSFVPIAERLRSDDSVEIVRSMHVTLALLSLMAIWWFTEAMPLPVTALLPAIVFPLFHIIGMSHGSVLEFTPRTVLVNYANPVIYLFLGGFLMAAAAQKWKLDIRFTLWLLTRGNLANDTRKVILAMMGVSAFISMWISNTAAVAMLLPLGLGIIAKVAAEPGESRFGTALMLGIAWAASIGGVGTIIGTPPNGIALGILNTTFADDPSYVRITFFDWMKFGVPYVLIFIPIAWLALITIYPPERREIAAERDELLGELERLGRFTIGEKRTLLVLALVIALWLTNPFWPHLLPERVATQLSWIDEFSIGLIGGVLLFLIPVNFKERKFILTWKDTSFVDWGVLILFGGGIALSDVMFRSGLAAWIAESFVGLLGTPSPLLLLIMAVLFTVLLTEITSNTAVTSMMVPIMVSVAGVTGGNPMFLAVATTVAASMAFMLPVATPPNALVYASGYVPLLRMIKTGLLLEIIGWILTVVVMLVFADWLFGVVKFAS
jgi:sodium-dependent dicarboxylate transporter 2/3/5